MNEYVTQNQFLAYKGCYFVNRICPSKDELKKFLESGQVPLDSTGLQAHLDTCSLCQTVLEELTAADWIPALDSQGYVASDPQLQRWMEHLVQSSSPCNLGIQIEPPASFPDVADADVPLGRLREFRILQRLASGAQGTMYLAHDEKLNRKVAIKVLHQGLLTEEVNQKRFAREARLAASLNDERIVRVFQVSQEPDCPPFIVMEYVAGCSLRQHLERSRPTIDEAVRWVRDAALGLAVAHQSGLIHRDIKPSNLMLDEKTGLTRLTDFGLALEQSDANRMTQEGVLAGTPAYMSPEQLSRPEFVDKRTDIYSLGVVFYELMAGEVPFRGTLRMTLLQVAHDEPRSPRQFNDQIPVDLETIVLKAMARDPNLRFSSAKELADELERWQQGIPILSRPTGRLEQLWRWCRRRPAVAALSASTLGLFLILAIVLLISYFQLEQSARQKQLAAETATQQRDAALKVLSKLVFQLQTQFEQDIVDVDDLQKNTLQIAIDGLSRLKRLADQGQFPEELTAEAFRKMGDILSRLDQIDEARDFLVRAERGFRQLQTRPESRQKALEGIVETLWSRHDLELDAGTEDVDGALTHWLRTATQAARELYALAPAEKTKLLLAQALVHEVQSDFDNAEVGRVMPGLEDKLAEIHKLVELEEDPGSANISESVRLWVQSVVLESRYQIELAHYQRARHLLTGALSRLRKRDEPLALFSPVLSHEMTLEYLLYTVLLDSDANEQASAALDHIEQELERLKNLVADDSTQLKAGLEFLQELADRFEQDNDEEGRLFFLEHVRGLLEMRLAQVEGDEFACLARAYCRSEIAEAKTGLDYPKRDIRDAYREAISDYRELSARAFFEEMQWYDYCNVLLAAAEFEQEAEGNDIITHTSEARRVRDKLSSDFQFSPELIDRIDERLDDLAEGK